MLTEKDYCYLYPFFSPNQIKAEFGEASKSARTIQRLYKDKGSQPQKQALQTLIKSSVAIADLEVPWKDWLDYVAEEIGLERAYRKTVVRTRLRVMEGLYS